MQEQESRKAAQRRRGVIVLVGLLVLTALEVWVSVSVPGPLVYLAVLAIVKAGLIINYFMHLPQLWQAEESEGTPR